MTRRPLTRRFTVVEILMVVVIIALVALISIPGVIAAKKYANEGSAQGSRRQIGTQEALFKEADSESDDKHDYGNLQELMDTDLVDSVLGAGRKAGYLFEVAPSTTTPNELWFAIATPIVPTKTGDRYFCTNQSGVLYYTSSGPIPMNTTTCEPPAGVQTVE